MEGNDMKKTYMKPDFLTLKVQSNLPLLTGSNTFSINSSDDDAVEGDAVLARGFGSIWDDDEE